MGSKITIVGAGSVGSTIAHILSLKPYVSELVMIDILKDKADGEIMDMAQGTGFRDPISMIAGDYEDAAGSDIVIVTSGVARKPGQTRIELAKTNVAIMKNIAPQVAKHAPNALCIIVANPVDVLTYAFLKYSFSFPFIHNQFTDRQSQTCPLRIFIQFFKTLEHQRLFLLRNTASRVRHRKDSHLRLLIHRKIQRYLSLFCKLIGIGHQIDNHLLHTLHVRLHSETLERCIE